ncbi:O-antigen/teichoic acid export membrane protein [Methanohalophilus euhalobius]|uniref:Membrane protein involved in the export of O-antigen and teichoic acid n=1 Tax=Methanohalophilus euhalobius TaxID=51203 RepID=A0A285GAN3_9EURY|nr:MULTISPECIES: flippase [Methanohalophilus]ODV48852.1 MAG: polysaccharide biosynthesis protein [Methanohalophilus sp. 2-GBenrich]TCL11598.1 O-antigen/teichoic acid export membrane protein [Methanohalophilus euhalobius]SNY20632.1 Membrane protein involved in the export of O-antigen and teichoic acid [Methanohalophilus euhalobius]
MSDLINKSLNKITKSSSIVLVGTFFSLFLGFLGKIIFARYTAQYEYGIFTLGVTVVLILTTISTLGLQEGSVKYIAHFRGKNDPENIKATIFSSIIISLTTSIFITVIFFMASNFIATDIFNASDASLILKILSVSIPFSVLISIIIAIYRSFNITKTKVFFSDFLRPIVYLLFLTVIILLGRSYVAMVCAYVISIVITGLTLTIYFLKKPPFMIKWNEISANNITKDLVSYSIPLFVAGILLTIMSWTDTLMLGYFKNPDIVGAYNAAYPISSLLSIIISSLSFLYVPIISQLYSKNQVKELGIINATLTKWGFMLTLPFFFIVFIFPDFVLNLLFGPQYTEASTTLQILSIGFISNSYFGFNYYTLLSTGKSNFLMKCSFISAILNIILNLILIPMLSMNGAAIASASSFILIEIYMTISLYKFLKIHPYSRNYLKITMISILLVLGFYLSKFLFSSSFFVLIMFVSMFMLFYVFLILFSQSLDNNDILMLQSIKNKI